MTPARFVQKLKAESSIQPTWEKSMLVRLVHASNANLPIRHTVSGRLRLVSGQPEKVDCPMICVPLEIVTLARLVQ